jgi:ribonuclease P protein component
MPQFGKNERLKSQKVIQTLFKSGKVEFLYPFRVVFLVKEETDNVLPQVFFSISKKNFKKAVDRNWIRRRMRELYRLHKTEMMDLAGNYKASYLTITYIAKEKIGYSDMKKKILPLFRRFKE